MTTISDNCLNMAMTAREAEQLWVLSSGTVRAALVRGIIKGRKSGGTWLVSHSVMVQHYGPPPNQPINATVDQSHDEQKL